MFPVEHCPLVWFHVKSHLHSTFLLFPLPRQISYIVCPDDAAVKKNWTLTAGTWYRYIVSLKNFLTRSSIVFHIFKRILLKAYQFHQDIEMHSLNNVMVETYYQKINEHSKELLVHAWLNIILMQLFRSYNTTNINDRKKCFHLKQFGRIWSNFWQVIVTEYFVEIYDTFELGQHISMNILPKSLNFKTWLYHSVMGICLFWLISYG